MSWQPDAQPTGWQPDGWQPDGSVQDIYPSIAASRRIALPSGGIWIVDPDVPSYCEVDWSGVLPDGVALVSVAYTLPASLTDADEAIDIEAGKTAIMITGASHGSTSAIAMVATLSNASTISFTAPLRCFNG